MLTSSVILLMIINTVTASAAPFVALQACTLEAVLRAIWTASAAPAAWVADGGLLHQEGRGADAAWQPDKTRKPQTD